uniref:DNA-directed RNA polymerase n=1 Tax=Chlamydomonas applanata TaxID=35704 RepID=A0A0S2LQ33_CHLAP|nr:beta subunit of RNA polymerase [Chlamydomonas applanata]
MQFKIEHLCKDNPLRKSSFDNRAPSDRPLSGNRNRIKGFETEFLLRKKHTQQMYSSYFAIFRMKQLIQVNSHTNTLETQNSFQKIPPVLSPLQNRLKRIDEVDSLSQFCSVDGLQGPQTANQNYKFQPIEYELENFHRSNQDTCVTHKPAVFEGDWVHSGDMLTDCASSVGGELALGQNLLIAYMPWEGYNFEDAILISERLVMDDLYTSVHIERYEMEVQPTNLGNEEITRDIPDITETELEKLDSFGVVKVGSWVEEGDILIGKITPIQKNTISPYQKLLYTILEKQVRPFRDSSLRAPKGVKAKVIDIKYFYKLNTPLWGPAASGSIEDTRGGLRPLDTKHSSSSPTAGSTARPTKGKKTMSGKTKSKKKMISLSLAGAKETVGFNTGVTENAIDFRTNPSSVSGEKHPHFSYKQKTKTLKRYSWVNNETLKLMDQLPGLRPGNVDPFCWRSQRIQFNDFGENERAKGRESTSSSLYQLTDPLFSTDFIKSLEKMNPSQRIGLKAQSAGKARNTHVILRQKKLIKLQNVTEYTSLKNSDKTKTLGNLRKLQNIEKIHIYLAETRKIQVGDKMSGRHGNKGIVSQILPIQDMPYLPDGTPIDMVLNPLGVPSRMNVGQIYECLLGLAGKYLGENYKISCFDEVYGPDASRSFVLNKLYEARKTTGFKWLFDPNTPGKMRIYDGRTGSYFDQAVTVGRAYMLRLVHMVDDKIHMRSTGPYSLVTQQPLRGRSKEGGQRLGEMEVWAMEGYGAAFILLEMLTIKSDDMTGRMTLWSNLILNKEISIGTPESFKVLICELQALCLDIGLFRSPKASVANYSSLQTTSGQVTQSREGRIQSLAMTNNQNDKLIEIDSLINLP